VFHEYLEEINVTMAFLAFFLVVDFHVRVREDVVDE
jgi:hypothetical protein